MSILQNCHTRSSDSTTNRSGSSCRKKKKSFQKGIQRIIKDLLETVREAEGAGLAAPQFMSHYVLLF